MKNGLIRFTINDITAWKTNNCNILQKQLPNIPRAIPDRKCFKKYLLIVQAMEQETNLRGSYDILINNMSKKKRKSSSKMDRAARIDSNVPFDMLFKYELNYLGNVLLLAMKSGSK